MPEEHVKRERYRGFDLAVAMKAGRLQGRAYPSSGAKIEGLTASISTDPADAKNPMRELRSAVDRAYAVRMLELQALVGEKHEAYLADRRLESRGRQPIVGMDIELRTAHCHKCGFDAVNLHSPQCNACRRIVCLHCGACLCGTIWASPH